MKEKKTKPLSTRCKALRKWLEDNFVSGKFFTIEEVVEGVKDDEGKPYYELNANLRIHDKCFALSKDIKEINRKQIENFIPIIKDNKGSCKLAENKEELTEFIEDIRAEAKNKAVYCNMIISKTNMQDTIPLLDINDKVIEVEDMKPVNVFMGQ